MSRASSRADAVRAAAAAREKGLTVVFTNGCFDLLHVGHVRVLGAARREGDVLLVGVNEDESVTRLKGPGRPLTPLADRLEVLSALAAVDIAFGFPEDTPLEAIREIRPDVLVKGADYAAGAIVGAELVRGWGGRVVRVPLVEGRSTSDLARRARRGGEEGPPGS